MRFILRNWWKLALILIVAGAALAGLGWSFGARGGYVYIDRAGLHVSVPNKSGDSDSSSDEVVIDEQNLAAFANVSVTTVSADIEFVPSDHYGLEARLSSAGGAPSWTVENGKLTVNANAEGWLVNLFSFSGENLHYVKIYYPAGASFTGVTLETSSGDVKLPQTAVENLAVTSVSGNVRAEADGYGTAFIQTSSGDVTFSGAAEPTIKVGADATATVTYGMLINGDGTVSVTTITTSDGKQYKINMDGRWTSSDGTPVFGIPDGVTNLIIDTVSGNIHANAENCGGVTLISVSGDISLTGGGDTPAAVNLKTVSGTVAAGGMVWNALAAESSSGDIRVSGTPQGTSTVKSVSGDVALTLQTRAALIAYDLSSVSGSIAVGGTGMGSPARSAAGTPADKLVDAKTSSGDIRVDFTE